MAYTKNCEGCGQPMIFIKNHMGKNMPCDAEEIAWDDLRAGETAISSLDGRRYTKEEGMTPPRANLSSPWHIPHWANCPDAEKFRSRKREVAV